MDFNNYSNDHASKKSDHLSQERVHPQERAKDILMGAQNTLDMMKKENVDKDRQIEIKNREIVKLRMLNEELLSNIENNEILNVGQ